MFNRFRWGWTAIAAMLITAAAAPVVDAATKPHTAAPRTGATHLKGTVRSVSDAANSFVLGVTSATGAESARFLGHKVMVALAASTTVSVAGDHHAATVAEVTVGDHVAVTASPAAGRVSHAALTAQSLSDGGPPPPPAPALPSTPTSPSPSSPATAPSYWAFDGTVAGVDAADGAYVVTIAHVWGAPSSYVGRRQQFTVDANTHFREGDVNGNGTVNLSDVAAGDTVDVYVVAPATPPTTGAPLDTAQLSDISSPPPQPPAPTPTPPSSPPPTSPPSTPTYWALDGTVTAVDPGAGTYVLAITEVSTAPTSYVGRQQEFSVDANTRLRGTDAAGNKVAGLADVSVGDTLDVYVPEPSTPPTAGAPLPTYELSDVSGQESPSPTPTPTPAPTPPPPSAPIYWGFEGTVTSVNPGAGTYAVSITMDWTAPSSYVGRQQTFSTDADTSFEGTDIGGTQVLSLATVTVGDTVEVYLVQPSTTPAPGAVLDTYQLRDVSPQSSPAPSPPSTPTYWAFDGTVTSVNPTAGTYVMRVGQVWTAASAYVGQQQQFTVDAATRFKGLDAVGTRVQGLAAVMVGDTVDVYVAAPSPAPAVGAPLDTYELSDVTSSPSTG